MNDHSAPQPGLSRPTIALLAFALLYPLMMSVFFPTPFTDLREHINWGLNFPFYTWKHPPLQSWAAGIVALTGARDAWGYMIAGQALNILGGYYVWRAAREFISTEAGRMAIVLLAGSIFFIAALPTILLNADQVLFPLWAAIFYYALAALMKDHWRDWVLLGVFMGLALLAKYFSLLIIAGLLVAALWHVEFRKTFLNPKFYVAGIVGGIFAATNAVPMLLHPEFLHYPLSIVHPEATILDRLISQGVLVWSLVLYLLPAIVMLAIIAWRREGVTFVTPEGSARRFIITATIAILILTAGVVAGVGIIYAERYSHPIFAVTILALLSVTTITPLAREGVVRVAVIVWVVATLGSVGYALTVVNEPLREPAPAAADFLRERWAQKYTCGPAFIIGEKRPAHAVALYYPGVIGLSRNDFSFAQWVDRDRLDRLGLIVIGTPQGAADMEFAGEFATRTATESISLPYRRTWSNQRHTYTYYFLPPRDCAR